MPAWVRDRLVIHEKFLTVMKALNEFFCSVPKMVARRVAESKDIGKHNLLPVMGKSATLGSGDRGDWLLTRKADLSSVRVDNS